MKLYNRKAIVVVINVIVEKFKTFQYQTFVLYDSE